MAASLILQILASSLHLDVKSIAPDANFTSHGGDSMTALRFSMECRRRGIFIPVDSILSSPSVSHLLHQIRPSDEACLACTERGQTGPVSEVISKCLTRPSKRTHARKDSGYNSLDESVRSRRNKCQRRTSALGSHEAVITSVPSGQNELLLISMGTQDLGDAFDSVHELSDIQVSLFHGSMDSTGTNIIYYAESHQPSHVVHLKKAWGEVCRAEPIFCATYRSPEDGHLMYPQLHWREFKTSNWTVYQNALLAATGPGLPWPDKNTPMDLALRFTVIHYEGTSPDKSLSTIVWAVHHALIDGWSAGLLVQKVHLVTSGQAIQPGPSYIEILAAQREYGLCRKAEGDLFWAQQRVKLETAQDEPLLERPTITMEGVAGADRPGHQMHINLNFSPDEYGSIKDAAQQCSVTPATFFYAAWAICLGVFTDSENVVVGAVLSTRNLGLSGSFETIGPMVNTLPLQVDLCWEVSVRDFVKDVFDRMRHLMHYSWTTPDSGFTRIKGNLMAMTPNEQQWAEGSVVRSSFFKHTTNLPLNVIAKDDGSGMILQYSSQRFSQNAMETLAGVFKVALTSLCETEAPLESARLLPSSYLESLSSMGNWKSQKTTVPSITEDLVTLFEHTVARYPSAVAIDAGGRQVTYAELNSFSGKVANALSGQIEREEVVVVHADGSINWIIAVYGILRAGGIYCPLDKAHPQHYRDSLFESSTAKVFLATNSESMSKRSSTAEVALDIQAILDGHVSSSPSSECFTARAQSRPQDRAYLCFTSGSTGKPKGVMCTHQGLVAFQSDLDVRLGASVGTRIAQIMSVAFDGAIHELFSALSYGSTLVLRREGEEAGISHLKTVDCAILTPSLASVLDPDDFPRLRTVYLVGEIVPQTVCDTWSASKVVYNMYGPTEATCGATIKRLRPGEPVTIGGPNPSTRIYILDHHRRLAPPGRIGEIYLAGVQVSRGYIGRPEVTKERFLEDPFHGSGEFMYKTGDRGYWSEDGEIIFLGRADRQIKLHGFRVDLEDLEARILRACSAQYGVRAVAMTTNRIDDLVCMIQTESTDLVGIKDAIRKVLPAFAVPKYVSVAHSLPMTSNMKVDYRAIAHVADSSVMTESAHRAVKDEQLRTETEIAVAAVWSKVLEVAATAVKIGPESNFIQLGGHSLQQLKLTSSLRAVFGTHITMRMLLTSPTLRDLAAAIDEINKGLISAPSLQTSSSSGREHIDGLERFEPGPMEKEWWQKGQLNCCTSAFNVSWVARYNGNIFNQSRMIVAWNMVLSSHDIFRARYVRDHEHGLQRVLAKFPPRIEQRRRVDVRKELNRSFDLAEEAPVRVIVTENTVVAVFSHIVCDYTTLGLILHEAATAYQCCPSLLIPPRPQPCYLRVFSNAVDPACLDFWLDYLGDVKHARHAYLGSGGERRSYDGRSLTGLVSTSLWHRMQSCVPESGVTLQQLLVAAVAVALSAEDEEFDLTLGMPFINRHSEAEMKAVGLFLEPLPVRVRFGDFGTSVKSYLTSVQASSQRALAHAVPWDQLLNHLNVDVGAHLPNHPLFDCVASFHDARGQDANQHSQSRGGPWSKAAWGDGVEPQLVWSDGAKFKLMVECLAYDEDTLVLRLEYDTACFGRDVVGSEGRIEAVRRMILTAMDAIVSRQDCVFDELWGDLREAWRIERSFGFKTGHDMDAKLLNGHEDLFLKCFSQLNEGEA